MACPSFLIVAIFCLAADSHNFFLGTGTGTNTKVTALPMYSFISVPCRAAVYQIHHVHHPRQSGHQEANGRSLWPRPLPHGGGPPGGVSAAYRQPRGAG